MISFQQKMKYVSLAIGFLFGSGSFIVHANNHHCIDSTQQTDPCDKGCVPKYYGSYCNKSCSDNCDLACSQDTGKCLTGCDPSWFQNNCTRLCIGYCKKDVCDMRTGECLYGCLDGYYSPACDKQCSENCTGGVCDEFGGCQCKKGTQDMACYLECSDNCIGRECTLDSNGRQMCSKGCIAGKTGPFCQEWCPEQCSTCTVDGDCTIKNKEKQISKREVSNCAEWDKNKCVCCKENWRGPNCDIDCQACRYNYHNKRCSFTCAGGSYGEICHLTCPENCAPAYNGRSGCDKFSGLCHSGCLQGYHGRTCQSKCNTNCPNNICFSNNGSCVSCDTNKYGPQCENTCGHCKANTCDRNGRCTCQEGWYGPTCIHRCADKCVSDICTIDYRGNHVCVGACVDGFTGDDCLSECPQSCGRCLRKNGTCFYQNSSEIKKKVEYIPSGTVPPEDAGSGDSITTIILASTLSIAVIVCLVTCISFLVWKHILRKPGRGSKDAEENESENGMMLNEKPDDTGNSTAGNGSQAQSHGGGIDVQMKITKTTSTSASTFTSTSSAENDTSSGLQTEVDGHEKTPLLSGGKPESGSSTEVEESSLMCIGGRSLGPPDISLSKKRES